MKKKGMSPAEKKFAAGLVAASFISVWLVFGRALPAPADSPEAWSLAKSGGRIAAGADENGAIARFWSPRPPAALKEALLDVRGYTKNFPRVGKIDELSRHGDEVSAAGRFRFLGPLKVSFAFVARSVPAAGGAQRVEWKGMGTGLESNDGSWDIQPYEGGSAVTYRVRLRSGSALLPGKAMDRAIARGLPTILKDFQEGMQ